MMILLRGTVHYRGKNFVIVEQGGMGHRIVLPEDAVRDFDGEVVFYVHEAIRESEREFFGFRTIGDLEMFWKLIGISGVGPRVGQKIIYSGSGDEIRMKIMSGDLVFLTSIPGIGNKTAQKIILELKGALAEEPAAVNYDQDAFEALLGLGYTKKQAQEALVETEAENTDDRIRQALKYLAK
ncbi:Holliday junction branch migration protein RuvA [Patescibacteria group bacterium]|nr:Holliday junction branch migration protein RuvA [Patescibacteria group bacterium]